MTLTIDKSGDKMTVKDYLYGKLRFSTSLVKKLKYTDGGILVNGEHSTVRRVLCDGDTLTLAYDDTDDDISENVAPCDLPLDIIYEDEHIIALNKPAGMPTHPSHNHHTDTLANALAYYFAQRSRPFVFRAVNRLDADTSGIVLVAKSKHAAYLLASELQAHGFEKTYTALLHGRLDSDGRIELPIMRVPDSTMLRCADTKYTDSSKHALTVYSVIKASDDRTLVSASPITGRTHQLRVHFSYLGHPIFGDGLYGKTNDGSDFPRLALHCRALTFTHPFTGVRITLSAPVPDEITI
ncbi:MAG: RluA family pseudouridine synthase [Clostridia bacterium]|nr:RluA family pseudouridine synthase [Clostridia bacterium]